MQIRQMEVNERNFYKGEIRCRELSEYLESVDDLWDMEVVQMGATEKDTRCQFVADDSAFLYEEVAGARQHQTGCLNGERIVIAIFNEVALGGRWQGDTPPGHALGFAFGGYTLDMMLPAGSISFGAILPSLEFEERFEALTGVPAHRVFRRDHGMWLPMSAKAIKVLSDAWKKILNRKQSAQQTLFDELAASIAMVWNLDSHQKRDSAPPRSAWSNYRRVMERVRFDEKPSTPGSLSVETGISQRALHDAFHECVDMPPGRYLKLLQMNRIRYQLLRQEPGESSVTEIVSSLGVTELGRFAGNYRQIFGELPSETLNSGYHGPDVVSLGSVMGSTRHF